VDQEAKAPLRVDGPQQEAAAFSAAAEAGREDRHERCSAATLLQAAQRGRQIRHPSPAAADATGCEDPSTAPKPAQAAAPLQPDGWPRLAPDGLPENGSVFRNGFTGGMRPSSSPAWSSTDYIQGADYTSIGCQNPGLASWKPEAATWNGSFQRGSWDISDAALSEARTCQAGDSPETCTSSGAPSVDDNVLPRADGASVPTPSSAGTMGHAGPGVDGWHTEHDVAEHSDARVHLSSQIDAADAADAVCGSAPSATNPSDEWPTDACHAMPFVPAIQASDATADESVDEGGDWQCLPGLGLGEC